MDNDDNIISEATAKEYSAHLQQVKFVSELFESLGPRTFLMQCAADGFENFKSILSDYEALQMHGERLREKMKKEARERGYEQGPDGRFRKVKKDAV